MSIVHRPRGAVHEPIPSPSAARAFVPLDDGFLAVCPNGCVWIRMGHPPVRVAPGTSREVRGTRGDAFVLVDGYPWRIDVPSPVGETITSGRVGHMTVNGEHVTFMGQWHTRYVDIGVVDAWNETSPPVRVTFHPETTHVYRSIFRRLYPDLVYLVIDFLSERGSVYRRGRACIGDRKVSSDL